MPRPAHRRSARCDRRDSDVRTRECPDEICFPHDRGRCHARIVGCRGVAQRITVGTMIDSLSPENLGGGERLAALIAMDPGPQRFDMISVLSGTSTAPHPEPVVPDSAEGVA